MSLVNKQHDKILTDKTMTNFPVEKIRADFPILAEKIRNKPLVYLDNAATCQKPQAVIDSIVHLYSHDYANVHRGVHTLSVRSTDLFEGARTKVKEFINAAAKKKSYLSEAPRKPSIWSRKLMAKPISSRGRDFDYRDGTSFQYCALANALRANRGNTKGCAD